MKDWPPFRTAYLQEFPDAGIPVDPPVELAVVVAPASVVVSASDLLSASVLPPVVQVAAPAVAVQLPPVGGFRLL